MTFDEASNAVNLLGGESITILEAYSTCVDSAAATAAAADLFAQRVTTIMGAVCSGVTGAINANVAVPNGLLVSPSPSQYSPSQYVHIDILLNLQNL